MVSTKAQKKKKSVQTGGQRNGLSNDVKFSYGHKKKYLWSSGKENRESNGSIFPLGLHGLPSVANRAKERSAKRGEGIKRWLEDSSKIGYSNNKKYG